MVRGSDQPRRPPSGAMPVERAGTAEADPSATAASTRWQISRSRIDEAFSRAISREAVPGIVAIAAHKRDILYSGAFGKRNIDEAESMTLDTLCSCLRR